MKIKSNTPSISFYWVNSRLHKIEFITGNWSLMRNDYEGIAIQFFVNKIYNH